MNQMYTHFQNLHTLQYHSNEEELIITYNVNTLVNEEHKNLDIYRPRFIKVRLEDINDEIKECY